MNEIVNDLLSIVRLHAQILKDATQRAREAERELKDMRASLPHPCDGELYSDWTPQRRFAKVLEEVDEAMEAAESFFSRERWDCDAAPSVAYGNLMEELTDVITAITSFQEAVGCDLEARRLYQRKINRRNRARDGGKRFKIGQESDMSRTGCKGCMRI